MALPSVVASGSQLQADTLAAFNVGTNANYLLVGTKIHRSSAIGNVTGVTFNGNAMTLLDSDLITDTVRLKVWGKSVTSGETGDIVQTVTGSIVGKAIGAVSLMNQISIGTTAKNQQTSGTSLSISGLVASPSTLVVDFMGIMEVNVTTPAQDASQTLILLTDSAGDNQLGISRKADASGMTWNSLNNNRVIIIGVPVVGLDDSGSAGGAYIRRLHKINLGF